MVKRKIFRDLTPAEEGELSPKMYKYYLKERGIKNKRDYAKYFKRTMTKLK